MRQTAAFAELLRQHEELTQRFARLLHDDAGQVLTAIALQLSALEGVDRGELEQLNGTLDDLLERFREAQNALGGAVVAKRGLAAGLSQLARHRKGMVIEGGAGPEWPVETAQAAFRIVEALGPRRVKMEATGVVLEEPGVWGEMVEMLALVGGLRLGPGPSANTIRIEHANQSSHR
jgi:hypothetical protein